HVTGVQTCALPISLVSITRSPSSVSTGEVPISTRASSKVPGVGEYIGSSSLVPGVQWIRSSLVAQYRPPSPKYIHHLPWICWGTMTPALDQLCPRGSIVLKVSKSSKIGPCLVQVRRSGEVARQSWAIFRSHPV